MLHGCYSHYHIGSENCVVRAFETLRLYLKYSTHKHSVFKLLYMAAPAFQPKQIVVYFISQRLCKRAQ